MQHLFQRGRDQDVAFVFESLRAIGIVGATGETPYASKGYIARRGRPESTENLRAHDLVGYVEDLIYTPGLNYASDILANWRSTIEVATAIGQVEAVRAGAGIGVLHDFMVAGMDLEPLLPDVRVERSYWTVWHVKMKTDRRVQAVVKFLDQTARAERRLFVRA